MKGGAIMAKTHKAEKEDTGYLLPRNIADVKYVLAAWVHVG